MLLLLVTFHTSFLYILCLSHKLVSPPSLPFDPPLLPFSHYASLSLSRPCTCFSPTLSAASLFYCTSISPTKNNAPSIVPFSESMWCDSCQGARGTMFFFQPSFAGTKWTAFNFKSYPTYTLNSLLARVCWDNPWLCHLRYIYIYNLDDINQ